jgi:hypothetical protein
MHLLQLNFGFFRLSGPIADVVIDLGEWSDTVSLQSERFPTLSEAKKN